MSASRCECCDNVLSYKESTNRFVTAPEEPKRYVNMCERCIKESLVGIPIIRRNDMPEDEKEDDTVEAYLYQVKEEDDGDVEENDG